MPSTQLFPPSPLLPPVRKLMFVQGRCVGHALAGQALVALGRTGEAKAQLEARLVI